MVIGQPDQPDDASQLACTHCGSALTAADPRPFCCHGCQTAFAVLEACGLGQYATIRQGVAPLKPQQSTADLVWVDSPSFVAAQVHVRSDGRNYIRWRIEGVHCAACVWVLERLPRVDPHIVQARLDVSADTLDIIAEADFKPSAQRALLASLGYRLRPYNASRQGPDVQARRTRLMRLVVALASAMGSMHIALSVVAGDATGELDAATRQLYAIMALVVAAPGLTYGAWPFWQGLRTAWVIRRLTLDAVTALVLALAIGAGLWSCVRGEGDFYIDAAALFVALLSSARFVLAIVRERVQRSLAHGPSLFGESAVRQVSSEMFESVAVADLRSDNVVRVSAGNIVPCDGIVIRADGCISTAVLTGESRPLQIDVGHHVWAGSLCVQGHLDIRCVATGEDTRVGQLVQQARGQRLEQTSTTDRWMTWFAPGVVLLAALTAGWWWYWNPANIVNGVVAVVLVTCPCALGIGAPLAGAWSLARAARRGILIRDPEQLLRFAAIQQIVFDKTGTITEGAPRCISWMDLSIESVDGSIDGSIDGSAAVSDIAIIGALAQRSAHPMSQALVQKIEQDDGAVEVLAFDQVTDVPGAGIRGVYRNSEWAVGSAIFVGWPKDTAIIAGSAVYATCDGRAVGAMACDDPVQEGAAQALKYFLQLGVRLGLASGDHRASALQVAEIVGIPADLVYAEHTPEQKAEVVRQWQTRGSVAMIGDGVNDAAALSMANVGIGLHGGLAACLERCDIVVPAGRLSAIVTVHQGSIALRTCIRRCLAVSLVYNVIGIAGIWAGWIGPIICAVAMPLSSLTVVVIAARCGAFREPVAAQAAPAS